MLAVNLCMRGSWCGPYKAPKGHHSLAADASPQAWHTSTMVAAVPVPLGEGVQDSAHEEVSGTVKAMKRSATLLFHVLVRKNGLSAVGQAKQTTGGCTYHHAQASSYAPMLLLHSAWLQADEKLEVTQRQELLDKATAQHQGGETGEGH